MCFVIYMFKKIIINIVWSQERDCSCVVKCFIIHTV